MAKLIPVSPSPATPPSIPVSDIIRRDSARLLSVARGSWERLDRGVDCLDGEEVGRRAGVEVVE